MKYLLTIIVFSFCSVVLAGQGYTNVECESKSGRTKVNIELADSGSNIASLTIDNKTVGFTNLERDPETIDFVGYQELKDGIFVLRIYDLAFSQAFVMHGLPSTFSLPEYSKHGNFKMNFQAKITHATDPRKKVPHSYLSKNIYVNCDLEYSL